MRAPTTIALVVLLGMALVPSTAAAQRCSDEDVAAIDQYCELISAPEGDVPLTRSVPRLRDTLPMSLRRQLLAGGAEGHAVLALPAVVARAGSRADQPLPDAAGALAGQLGSQANVVGGVARAVGAAASGRSGLTDAFGWVLLMSTLAIAGAVWVRQRR